MTDRRWPPLIRQVLLLKKYPEHPIDQFILHFQTCNMIQNIHGYTEAGLAARRSEHIV